MIPDGNAAWVSRFSPSQVFVVNWLPGARDVSKITVAIERVRRHAGAGLARRQFVRGVVGVGRRGSAVHHQRPVADGVVGIRDVVAVRPAPLLVRQLVSRIVAPSHHRAVDFNNLGTVANGVICIIEARKSRPRRGQVRQQQNAIGVIIRV